MSNDNQPRKPKGSPEAGQWTTGQNAEADSIHLSAISEIDEDPRFSQWHMKDHGAQVVLSPMITGRNARFARSVYRELGTTETDDRGNLVISRGLDAYPEDTSRAFDRFHNRVDVQKIALALRAHDDSDPQEPVVVDVESEDLENFVADQGNHDRARQTFALLNPVGRPLMDSLEAEESDHPTVYDDAVLVRTHRGEGVHLVSGDDFDTDYPEVAEATYQDLVQQSGVDLDWPLREGTRRELRSFGPVLANEAERQRVKDLAHRDLYLHLAQRQGRSLEELHADHPQVTADDEQSVRNNPSLTLAKHLRDGAPATSQTFAREALRASARRRYGQAPYLSETAQEIYPGIAEEDEKTAIVRMSLSPQRNAEIPEECRTKDGVYHGVSSRSVILRTFADEARLAGDSRGLEFSVPRERDEYWRRERRSREVSRGESSH